MSTGDVRFRVCVLDAIYVIVISDLCTYTRSYVCNSYVRFMVRVLEAVFVAVMSGLCYVY